MEHYNKQGMDKLNNFLYNSDIHDSYIEGINYDYKDKLLVIKTFNPICRTGIRWSFKGIEKILYTGKTNIGASESIVSLTVEADYICSQKSGLSNDKIENCIYLLFQMFSGAELHVASENVFTESFEIQFVTARREIAVRNIGKFQDYMGSIAEIYEGITEDELLNLMMR